MFPGRSLQKSYFGPKSPTGSEFGARTVRRVEMQWQMTQLKDPCGSFHKGTGPLNYNP